MGRTNPTFRDRLRRLRERWAAFRRGLRRADKPRFDRLFEYADAHADAGGYLDPPDPMHAVGLSVDLEQEARLDAQAERVDAQAERLDAQAERLDALEARVRTLETAVDGGNEHSDSTPADSR